MYGGEHEEGEFVRRVFWYVYLRTRYLARLGGISASPVGSFLSRR